MRILDRRLFLKAAGGLALGTFGLGSYAFGVEPGMMLDVTSYKLDPPHWPGGYPLKIAVIADIHACEPWMSAARVRSICEVANGLNPDLTVILGDFNAGHNFVTGAVMPDEWGEALTVLKAPLGVYSILGNHDLWHGALPRMRGDGGESIRRALKAANVTLLENDAVKIQHGAQSFWLAGLADQMAHRITRGHFRGADDLPGTLSQVTDDAPIILLAHEPYIFPHVPDRVSLTLCGHTHGGQVNLPFIGDPLASARFGRDYVYGHAIENGRHLIISAGLGTSILPVRFLRPPEVVSVTLGHQAIA